MTRHSKDSREVVTFRTLFARLRDWTDDVPEKLLSLCEQDKSIEELCFELFLSAQVIEIVERLHPQLFSSPVDPQFLVEWRDYEKRFKKLIEEVFSARIQRELQDYLLNLDIDPNDQKHANSLDFDGDTEDEKHGSSGTVHAMDIALDYADEKSRLYFESSDVDDQDAESFRSEVQKAVLGWTTFRNYMQFDLDGALRRRKLVPFVLIPRQVAAKGASTRLMFRQLQQAHEAFVYGCPSASLSLMRSVMEEVLCNHYDAQGESLSKRISHARKRLPPRANEAALDRLRKLANESLHLDHKPGARLPKLDEAGLEKEIVYLLYVLRELIEGVGSARRSG